MHRLILMHNLGKMVYNMYIIIVAEFCWTVSAGGKNARMEAGNHRLPFSFILPPTVPSSFESKVGYVRYTAEATMERSWKFNHVTRSAFTVISIVDLNMEPMEYRVNISFYTLTYCWPEWYLQGGGYARPLTVTGSHIYSTPLIRNLQS